MKKQKYTIIILILLIGIGFAYLSTNLKISSIGLMLGNSWDVHFENIVVENGSVESIVEPYTDNITTTEMTFVINLNTPGDYYKFNVDIANRGTIDAMVKNAPTISVNSDIDYHFIHTYVYYSNDVEIFSYDLLEAGTSKNIIILVEYDEDVNVEDLLDDSGSISFNISLDFVQATEEANEVSEPSFSNMTWKKIAECSHREDLCGMNIGDTRLIDIADKGFHLFRIANTSYNNLCYDESSSQSACGFVIESVDIVYLLTGSGLVGKWNETVLYDDLNNNIFLNLSENLKEVIIPTRTKFIAGDEELKIREGYFYSNDYLYALSVADIIGSSSDKQLDYYTLLNLNKVTKSDYYKKKIDDYYFYWWMRDIDVLYNSSSDFSYMNQYMFSVSDNGVLKCYTLPNEYTKSGVSFAFRIG